MIVTNSFLFTSHRRLGIIGESLLNTNLFRFSLALALPRRTLLFTCFHKDVVCSLDTQLSNLSFPRTCQPTNKEENCNIVTMKVAALLLALASSASAFAPATHNAANTQLAAKLDEMAGFTAPFKGFDPLDLADLGSDETLAWFRAAELKHSRVAMLATTGYIVQASGYHLPGMLSKDVSFESLSSMKPFDAWDAVPEGGK
jgi:hypothetical protein